MVGVCKASWNSLDGPRIEERFLAPQTPLELTAEFFDSHRRNQPPETHVALLAGAELPLSKRCN